MLPAGFFAAEKRSARNGNSDTVVTLHRAQMFPKRNTPLAVS